MSNHRVVPQLLLLYIFCFNRLWWVQDRAAPLRNDNIRQRLYEAFDDNITYLL